MYCICEDLSKRRQPFYTIDASHKWGLPGVECPRCGKWTGIGNAYPHVELSTLPNERWYRTGRNVSVAEYMKCVEQVEVLLPEGAFLEPGTKFGPLEGDARGTFNDVSWMSPWILIMRRDAVEKLAKDVKPDLISVPLELSYRGKGPCDLVEVFVEARSRVSDSYTPGVDKSECEICGRTAFPAEGHIILDKTTVPADVDIFRGKDLTTYIFVTDRFRDAVLRNGLVGAHFEEVLVE